MASVRSTLLLISLVSLLVLAPALASGRTLTQSAGGDASAGRCASFGTFNNGKRPTDIPTDPNQGYTEYSDSFSYTVSTQKLTYNECTAYCANEYQTDGVQHTPSGSTFNLASVNSQAENDFILANVASLSCGAGDKTDALWLGAHQDSTDSNGNPTYVWDMAAIDYGFDQSFDYQNFCRVTRIKARMARAIKAGKKAEPASTTSTTTTTTAPAGECVSFMPLAVDVNPADPDADGGCAAGTWRRASCTAKKQCLCKFVSTLVYDHFPKNSGGSTSSP